MLYFVQIRLELGRNLASVFPSDLPDHIGANSTSCDCEGYGDCTFVSKDKRSTRRSAGLHQSGQRSLFTAGYRISRSLFL